MSFLSRACVGVLVVAAGACASEQQNTGDIIGANGGHGSGGGSGSGSGSAMSTGFARVDLVADTAALKPRRVDPQLVNAWGFTAAEGAFWIAANGTGAVRVYDGTGADARVTTPKGGINLGMGGITDIVENRSSSFEMHSGSDCVAAQFIASDEAGHLIAFSPALASSRNGVIVVDRSSVAASYKSLAIVHMAGGMFLLAADFHNGRIDIFDANFNLVTSPSTLFVDTKVKAGMAPFDVVALDDKVYVTYAQQDDAKFDSVKGLGLGAVAEFDLTGKMLREVLVGGDLNAPWGVALAPGNFCKSVGHALLIGNFGDGHIVAVDLNAGTELGILEGNNGQALAIDGLWGLVFAGADANVANAKTSTLYFTAGPNDENDGLFGMITANE